MGVFEKINRIHFVGIGGSGMSGIAEVLLNTGYRVSGSDISESETTRRLEKLGAEIFIGHAAENIRDPHVVVTSSAVPEDNCEVLRARSRNITVIPRAEMLAELMRLKYSVCVAGTHGKTTTTSMAGLVLSKADLDPTVVIGGRLKNLASGVKLGKGQYLVAEADESDGSFLHFTPTIAVVTNIDNDHMEYYGSMRRLRGIFTEFINKVPFYGFSVLCGDDRNLMSIIPDLGRPYRTYGYGRDNFYRALDCKISPEESSYTAVSGGKEMGRISIPVSGKHNILNSLAACAVGLEMGIGFDTVAEALSEYQGVGRRLEKAGEASGIVFYDDYAHHPTAIRLSIESLKEMYPGRRLVVAFQPHRYSRTRDLYEDFAESLTGADLVILTGIYPASEKPIEGVTSRLIADAFTSPEKVTLASCSAAPGILKEVLEEGDICLTLGAGDICQVLPEVMGRSCVDESNT